MDETVDKEDLISQFCNVTGMNRDRAKFYLESSAWQLNVAFASFYDDDDVDMEPEIIDSSSENSNVDDASASASKSSSDSSSNKAGKKSIKNSRFATLKTLGDDDQSTDDDNQAFYTGGSERSGQQVLGPPKKASTDLAKRIFESSLKDVSGEDQTQQASSSRGTSSFQGAGYRLGSSDSSSVIVSSSSSSSKKEKPRQVVLSLWQNGFTIDDGPLRDYSSPENKEFLEKVHNRELPDELIKDNEDVNLKMVNMFTTPFAPQRKSVKPFGGAGHVLGSPESESATQTNEKPKSVDSSASTNPLKVDEQKPLTNIQVRLTNGSRVVIKMNHDHTIQDIHNYIRASYPEYQSVNYVLISGFPRKELTDSTVSIAEANLLNAAITQALR